MEVEIARQDGEEKRVVTLDYAAGGLKLFTEDSGPTVRRMFGSSSYEISTVVAASAMPALAMAALTELLQGNPSADAALKDLCNRHAIAFETEIGTWGWVD